MAPAVSPSHVRESSDPIAPRRDYSECLRQRRLVIGLQYVLKYIMNGVLHGTHTEIKNPCTPAIQKDDATKVPVPGDKQPVLFLSCFEQLFVCGSRQTEIGGTHDIVSQVGQVSGCRCVNVLIEQKPQTGAARKRISSAPTKAIA